MSRRRRPRRRRRHRELWRAAGAQRRTSEGREFAAQRPRGGRLVRPGKFLSCRGWRRRLRDPAITETCRGGLAGSHEEASTGHPLEVLHLSTAAPNRAQPSKLRTAASFGDTRRRQAMPIRAPLSKPELRADGANQRDREISSIAPSAHQAERPLSARSGDLGQGNGKGRDAR
jgi:hypothetical protein